MQRLLLGTVSILVFASNVNSVMASTQFDSILNRSTISPTILIAEAESLANGDFVAVEHPTQGQASIVREGNNRYLELNADFQTDRGPDLKVILHRAETVNLKLEEGDYISLGALQEFSGNQRYAIPDDIDLSEYNSVAIWCEQFNATFGYAPLTK
ncbi:MAG: DM13 domain-containing protein [Xenococcaceae cyanobacterium MO_188.B32]|nr:DM13 domain-containing protein [Xenococcaceae cyanobacterium MO_188.B32]